MAVELREDPLHLAVVGEVEPVDDQGELCRQVVATLASTPMTRTALREHLGVRNERLGWALLALDGRVKRVGGLLTVPRSDP